MIRLAQLLLVLSATGLWLASRMTWVSLRSADGLGPEKTSVVDGATWSTALLPLAVLMLAATLAALAVRGLWLRLMAVLVAAGCLALGYLGVSLIVMPDIAPRGAGLAGVPIADLVGSERFTAGAVLTLIAAVCALFAAVLLMRSGSAAGRTPAKYRGTGEPLPGAGATLSERAVWEALDAGVDPTETEGR